jgi:hypothetical protein
MSNNRVFLDTAFVQALFNQDDGLHALAQTLMPVMRSAQIWITDLVLIEIGDALSPSNRLPPFNSSTTRS